MTQRPRFPDLFRLLACWNRYHPLDVFNSVRIQEILASVVVILPKKQRAVGPGILKDLTIVVKSCQKRDRPAS
jgi:hypothetical protein